MASFERLPRRRPVWPTTTRDAATGSTVAPVMLQCVRGSAPCARSCCKIVRRQAGSHNSTDWHQRVTHLLSQVKRAAQSHSAGVFVWHGCARGLPAHASSGGAHRQRKPVVCARCRFAPCSALPLRFGATRQSQSAHAAGDEIPIDQIPERFDILWPCVAVIDVIGVLPDIAGEQRVIRSGERG